MQTPNKYPTGFTLLGLLFLIVIIAVVTVGSLNALKNQQRANAVQHAAIEMQNIQQAAMAYYSQNLTWPLSMTDLLPSGSATNDGYLLPNGQCSPFFSSSPSTTGDCGNHSGYEIIAASDDIYFTVSLTVSGEELAEEIAVLLPNASVSSDDKTISSSVPMPGKEDAAHDPQALLIKQISMNYQCKDIDSAACNSTTASSIVHTPNHCPSGWSNRIKAAHAGILNMGSGTGTTEDGTATFPINLAVLTGNYGAQCQYPPAGNVCDDLSDNPIYGVSGYTGVNDFQLSSDSKAWELYACVHPCNVGWISGATNSPGDYFAGLVFVISYCEPPNYDPTAPYVYQ